MERASLARPTLSGVQHRAVATADKLCSMGQGDATDEIRLRQAYGATGFMGHLALMSRT
jgi:hypothetical protein